jgi:hypothetical protein
MREPANKTVLTDVSSLCSYRCTIIVQQLLWRFWMVQHVARSVLNLGHKSPCTRAWRRSAEGWPASGKHRVY